MFENFYEKSKWRMKQYEEDKRKIEIDENCGFEIEQRAIIFKVVIFGGICGKTQLLNRIVGDAFDYCGCTTIGVDFKIITGEVYGRNIKLQIWDTNGSERFKSIIRSYFSGADILILCIDMERVTKKHLDELWCDWFQHLSHQGLSDETSLIVVGTRMDLIKKGDRTAIINLCKSFAKQTGALKFFITSAKEDHGVSELKSYIFWLANRIYDKTIDGTMLKYMQKVKKPRSLFSKIFNFFQKSTKENAQKNKYICDSKMEEKRRLSLWETRRKLSPDGVLELMWKRNLLSFALTSSAGLQAVLEIANEKFSAKIFSIPNWPSGVTQNMLKFLAPKETFKEIAKKTKSANVILMHKRIRKRINNMKLI